ncbi:MAG: hypothetical protein M3297_03245, partial [Thermoproteota archaeon]|nr:hypothetical protein [Thermoproteota archaeon]
KVLRILLGYPGTFYNEYRASLLFAWYSYIQEQKEHKKPISSMTTLMKPLEKQWKTGSLDFCN